MDYWLRIISQKNRCYYIKERLGYYYIGSKGSNISLSLDQIDRNIAIYTKYKEKLTAKEQARVEIRICYDTARIFHMNGNFYGARRYYERVIHGRYNLIRSIIGYILVIFKKKY